MATIVDRLLKAVRAVLLRCTTYRIMWLFRSSSQDGEPARQCSTSQAMPLDVKAVRANMEKLRGYHELAKVSPVHPLPSSLFDVAFFTSLQGPHTSASSSHATHALQCMLKKSRYVASNAPISAEYHGC